MKSLVTIICAVILGFSVCIAGESGIKASTATPTERVRPVGGGASNHENSYNNENRHQDPVPMGIYKSENNDRIVIYQNTVKIVYDGKLSWWRITRCSGGYIKIENDEWASYNLRVIRDGNAIQFNNELFYKTQDN